METNRREAVLGYPIEQVKTQIKEVARLSKYLITEQNEVFNSYKIKIVSGFYTGLITIELLSVEDKTKWASSIINATAEPIPDGMLLGMQEDFIAQLSNLLTGKQVIIAKPNNNLSIVEILVIGFAMVALFVVAYIYIFVRD